MQKPEPMRDKEIRLCNIFISASNNFLDSLENASRSGSIN